MTAEIVTKEALKLSSDEKLELVHRLIESTDQIKILLSEDRITEANRRMHEVQSGEVATIPADEVFGKIRKKYRFGD